MYFRCVQGGLVGGVGPDDRVWASHISTQPPRAFDRRVGAIASCLSLLQLQDLVQRKPCPTRRLLIDHICVYCVASARSATSGIHASETDDQQIFRDAISILKPEPLIA